MDRIKHKLASLSVDISGIIKLSVILLVILSLYLIAKITWLTLAPADIATSTWQRPQAMTKQALTSKSDFSTYQWFGKHDAEKRGSAPEKVTKAPKTRLNLILSGLVASSKVENSMAIVEYQGKQETYGVDDKITGTRAVIHEIHHDRLILKNAGKYETLMLDGFDYTTQSVSLAAKNIANYKSPKKLANKLALTRATILKDPGKITDYISITPVRLQGNKIKGYRLNPGRDRSLFEQSGLKRNDLAVSINGYDLTDFGESIKVMNELKNMTDISITVERDGQLIDIQFSISQ